MHAKTSTQQYTLTWHDGLRVKAGVIYIAVLDIGSVQAADARAAVFQQRGPVRGGHAVQKVLK